MIIKLARVLTFGSLIPLFAFIQVASAGVTPDVQRALREGTFEVVMKKPEHDTVAYEKPLPLDLLPYIERTDLYRSVGTAFALGNNTYVTAAHVIEAGVASQFGRPALRRADGAVFEIDQILRFSEHEDFVVFSLQKDPGPKALGINRESKLDQVVLAVGNALGEGIVIRDGILTSETPEEQDGRWKWLRFSAAASPGNSGGPLCDADGKVMGIVVRKSPNENLNYALPIARAMDAQDTKARFDQRFLAGLPYLHGTTTYSYKDEFKLPLAWPAFVQSLQSVLSRHAEESQALVLKTYANELFPVGAGADDLLFDMPSRNANPRFVYQQADGTWTASNLHFEPVKLPGDGSVAVANAAEAKLLRLIRPNSDNGDALYADSKAFMDLALKALDVRRYVGSDGVRVVSLGAATQESTYTDGFGRIWQQRIWPIPFMDTYLVGQLLPTPDGYVALIIGSPSIALQSVIQLSRRMAGQIDVSYEGTLSQWQAALHRRALLPAALSAVKLDKSSSWTLQTGRFSSSVPTDVLPLTDKSPMTLVMGFTRDGVRATWGVQGVWWNQDERRDAGVGIWRRVQPPASVKVDIRNGFDSIRSRRPPYDGSLMRESAESYTASRIMDVPGKTPGTIASDLEYGVTLRRLGVPSVSDTIAALGRLIESTRLMERSPGADKPAPARQTATTTTTTDQAFATLERQMMSKAEEIDVRAGKDIRGRSFSDDMQELLRQMKADSAAMTQSGNRFEADRLFATENQRFSSLQAYWSVAAQVVRNRDLWSDFLRKNHLPPQMQHRSAVLAAEESLTTALSKPASPEWLREANALKDAYVAERGDLVKATKTDPNLSAPLTDRHTACPPAASATTGTGSPKFLRSARQISEIYPVESRRLGEEGLVIALIKISETGCVIAKTIAGSSGSDLLDEAVMEWLESVEFVPAGTTGHAVPSTVRLPVAFKLRDNGV